MAGTGFELVVRRVDRTSPTLVEDMRAFIERQKLFGVVLPSPVSEEERLVDLLKELDRRYVRISSTPLDQADRMVVSHDGQGAAQAAHHLAGLGHIRIALISGQQGRRSSSVRMQGFEEGWPSTAWPSIRPWCGAGPTPTNPGCRPRVSCWRWSRGPPRSSA